MAKRPVNTGAALYGRAKQRIPGGTQLLSKRPEMFLPDQWPAYYSKCKGCEIWDLDGHRLLDVSTMGIGACVLGYADEDVKVHISGKKIAKLMEEALGLKDFELVQDNIRIAERRASQALMSQAEDDAAGDIADRQFADDEAALGPEFEEEEEDGQPLV